MMPAGDESAMKIHLATDGFEGAKSATRMAAELAESTGAELHLVHVGLVPSRIVRRLLGQTEGRRKRMSTRPIPSPSGRCTARSRASICKRR